MDGRGRTGERGRRRRRKGQGGEGAGGRKGRGSSDLDDASFGGEFVRKRGENGCGVGRDSAGKQKKSRQRNGEKEVFYGDGREAGSEIGFGEELRLKKRKKQGGGHVGNVAQGSEFSAPAPIHQGKPVSLLDKMRARLTGGRFRMLNETLYTCRGEDAYELFQKEPDSFHTYHTGYQEQMSRWPQLPVEVVINWLNACSPSLIVADFGCGYQEQMSRWPQLPVEVVINWLNARSPSLIVADFGCGDGRLEKSVKNRVYSLDLVSSNSSVISCNMANTPLETASVDVAVFCLSLMGTDYPSYLQEANRVLKSRGFLIIAEVKSRFDLSNGGTDPQKFISALGNLGFSLSSQDCTNKMFIMFNFEKKEGRRKVGTTEIDWPELKACIYKRR